MNSSNPNELIRENQTKTNIIPTKGGRISRAPGPHLSAPLLLYCSYPKPSLYPLHRYTHAAQLVGKHNIAGGWVGECTPSWTRRACTTKAPGQAGGLFFLRESSLLQLVQGHHYQDVD